MEGRREEQKEAVEERRRTDGEVDGGWEKLEMNR